MTMEFPPMPLLPITSPKTVTKCKSLPLRPSDVFICSYPKSGTTWTQHIVLSLILADRRHRKTNDSKEEDAADAAIDAAATIEDYDHVSDYAPFFEIDAHWEPTTKDLAESVRRNHDRLNRRVFNTHLRWDMLPKHQEEEEDKEQQRKQQQNDTNENASSSPDEEQLSSRRRPACGKFIYVTRNLPDVCASFYHHLSNQKEGTYTSRFDAFVRDWIDGKIPFGSPLHHLLSFGEGFSDNRYYDASNNSGEVTGSLESSASSGSGSSNQQQQQQKQQQQQQQPLLILSYEKMKENLREEVLRILTFLNLTNIPIEVLDNDILPTFNFHSMKENAHRFQPKSVTWLNGYQFLRKGVSGDGKRMMMMENGGGGGCGGGGGLDEGGAIDADDGATLMDVFRDWVKREEYCTKIEIFMSDGLDEETAEAFLGVVE